MPFDYLHSSIPRNYLNAGEKAESQYLKELEERASLLYRLGFDEDSAKKRLRGNLAWDWECNPRPAFVESIKNAVEGIVEKIYSKPKPPEKGRRVTYQDLKTSPSD